MDYPPPPWRLRGAALCVLRLVKMERARPFVPPGLRLLPVLPGRTLGILYFAAYGPGSDLEYNELIVAPCLVRRGLNSGFWVSHIYVDHPGSQAGGREIWGLPKELARFHWQVGEQALQVEARQGETGLASLGGPFPWWGPALPLALPAVSRLGGKNLGFWGLARARLGLSSGRLAVPAASPLSALGFAGPCRVFYLDDLRFTARPPHRLFPS